MDALQAFCEEFKLEINYKKQSARHLLRETTQIENVKEFKYLGVKISKKNSSFQPNLK